MTGKKILIVDDDPMSRKLARDVLQANGYDTEEVITGEEAVAKTAQIKPNLIVMDIRLPGVDGLEATRHLKSDNATAGIPVITVTAQAMPGDEEKILEAGCQAYLAKPLRFKEFVSLVKTLLGDA
jgi:two-component system, cell cycle response regulator DivK